MLICSLAFQDSSWSNILDIINMGKWYFNNSSRILFTCNIFPCNISDIFKFQLYFKKMSSCFQAIIKFIVMNIFITKILIKILLEFSLLKRLLWRQFLCVRCNVWNTYLNIQIFVHINWFRMCWRVHVRSHTSLGKDWYCMQPY